MIQLTITVVLIIFKKIKEKISIIMKIKIKTI